MKKRVLSFLLMLAMVITALPAFALPAFAEGDGDPSPAYPNMTLADYDALYAQGGLSLNVDFFKTNVFWKNDVTVALDFPADLTSWKEADWDKWCTTDRVDTHEGEFLFDDAAERYSSADPLTLMTDFNTAYAAYKTAAANWLNQFVTRVSGYTFPIEVQPLRNAGYTGTSKTPFDPGEGYILFNNKNYESDINVDSSSTDYTKTLQMVADPVSATGNIIHFRYSSIGLAAADAGQHTLKVGTYSSAITKWDPDHVVFTPFTALGVASDYTVGMSFADGSATTGTMTARVNGAYVMKTDEGGNEIPVTINGKTAGNLDAGAIRIDYGSGFLGKLYAYRLYNRTLSDAEVAQNHFADLAKWYRLDLTLYNTLSASLKAAVQVKLLDQTIGGTTQEERTAVQEALDAAYADVYYPTVESLLSAQHYAIAKKFMLDISVLTSFPTGALPNVLAYLATPDLIDETDAAAVRAAYNAALAQDMATYYNGVQLADYEKLYVPGYMSKIDFFTRNAIWNAPIDDNGLLDESGARPANYDTNFRTYFNKYKAPDTLDWWVNTSGDQFGLVTFENGYVRFRNTVNASSMIDFSAQFNNSGVDETSLQLVMRPRFGAPNGPICEIRNFGLKYASDANGAYFINGYTRNISGVSVEYPAGNGKYFSLFDIGDFTFNLKTAEPNEISILRNGSEVLSATYSGNVNFTQIGWSGGALMDMYAMRAYPFQLTEAQIKQNHFADIAKYFGLKVDEMATFDDTQKAAVYAAMMSVDFDATRALAQSTYLDTTKEYRNAVYEGFKIAYPDYADFYTLAADYLLDCAGFNALPAVGKDYVLNAANQTAFLGKNSAEAQAILDAAVAEYASYLIYKEEGNDDRNDFIDNAKTNGLDISFAMKLSPAEIAATSLYTKTTQAEIDEAVNAAADAVLAANSMQLNDYTEFFVVDNILAQYDFYRNNAFWNDPIAFTFPTTVSAADTTIEKFNLGTAKALLNNLYSIAERGEALADDMTVYDYIYGDAGNKVTGGYQQYRKDRKANDYMTLGAASNDAVRTTQYVMAPGVGSAGGTDFGHNGVYFRFANSGNDFVLNKGSRTGTANTTGLLTKAFSGDVAAFTVVSGLYSAEVNGNSEYTRNVKVYRDTDSLTVDGGATWTYSAKSTEGLIGHANGAAFGLFAFRVYADELTVDEIRQNNFADLAKFYKINAPFFKSYTAEQKAEFIEAFEGYRMEKDYDKALKTRRELQLIYDELAYDIYVNELTATYTEADQIAFIELMANHNADIKEVLAADAAGKPVDFVYDYFKTFDFTGKTDGEVQALVDGTFAVAGFYQAGNDDLTTFLKFAVENGLNVIALMSGTTDAGRKNDNVYAFTTQTEIDEYVDGLKAAAAASVAANTWSVDDYNDLYVKDNLSVQIDFFKTNVYWNSPATAVGSDLATMKSNTASFLFNNLGGRSTSDIRPESVNSFTQGKGYIKFTTSGTVWGDFLSIYNEPGFTSASSIQVVARPGSVYNKQYFFVYRGIDFNLRAADADTYSLGYGTYITTPANMILNGEQTAYVTQTNPSIPSQHPTATGATGVTFPRETVGDFTVYYGGMSSTPVFVKNPSNWQLLVEAQTIPMTYRYNTTYLYNGTYTYPAAMRDTNITASSFGLGPSSEMSLYAIRLYNGDLTNAQIKQNHFVDIAKYYALNIDGFADYTNTQKEKFYDAFAGYTIGAETDTPADIQNELQFIYNGLVKAVFLELTETYNTEKQVAFLNKVVDWMPNVMAVLAADVAGKDVSFVYETVAAADFSGKDLAFVQKTIDDALNYALNYSIYKVNDGSADPLKDEKNAFVEIAYKYGITGIGKIVAEDGMDLFYAIVTDDAVGQVAEANRQAFVDGIFAAALPFAGVYGTNAPDCDAFIKASVEAGLKKVELVVGSTSEAKRVADNVYAFTTQTEIDEYLEGLAADKLAANKLELADYDALYVQDGLRLAVDFYKTNVFWKDDVTLTAGFPKDLTLWTKADWDLWCSGKTYNAGDHSGELIFDETAERYSSDSPLTQMADFSTAYAAYKTAVQTWLNQFVRVATSGYSFPVEVQPVRNAGQTGTTKAPFDPATGYILFNNKNFESDINVGSNAADYTKTLQMIADPVKVTGNVIHYRLSSIGLTAAAESGKHFLSAGTYSSAITKWDPDHVVSAPFTALGVVSDYTIGLAFAEADSTIGTMTARVNGAYVMTTDEGNNEVPIAIIGNTVGQPGKASNIDGGGTRIDYGSGFLGQLFAYRLYGKTLTDAEVAQNHFADLAKYYRVNLAGFSGYSAAVKSYLYDAFADYAIEADATKAAETRVALQVACSVAERKNYMTLTDTYNTAAQIAFIDKVADWMPNVMDVLTADVGGKDVSYVYETIAATDLSSMDANAVQALIDSSLDFALNYYVYKLNAESQDPLKDEKNAFIDLAFKYQLTDFAGILAADDTALFFDAFTDAAVAAVEATERQAYMEKVFKIEQSLVGFYETGSAARDGFLLVAIANALEKVDTLINATSETKRVADNVYAFTTQNEVDAYIAGLSAAKLAANEMTLADYDALYVQDGLRLAVDFYKTNEFWKNDTVLTVNEFPTPVVSWTKDDWDKWCSGKTYNAGDHSGELIFDEDAERYSSSSPFAAMADLNTARTAYSDAVTPWLNQFINKAAAQYSFPQEVQPYRNVGHTLTSKAAFDPAEGYVVFNAANDESDINIGTDAADLVKTLQMVAAPSTVQRNMFHFRLASIGIQESAVAGKQEFKLGTYWAVAVKWDAATTSMVPFKAIGVVSDYTVGLSFASGSATTGILTARVNGEYVMKTNGGETDVPVSLTGKTASNLDAGGIRIGYDKGFDGKLYAYRMYAKTLSNVELRQNHFADLAKFYRLNVAGFASLTDAQKAIVFDTFDGYTVEYEAGKGADVRAELQVAYDAAVRSTYLLQKETYTDPVQMAFIDLVADWTPDISLVMAGTVADMAYVFETVDAAALSGKNEAEVQALIDEAYRLANNYYRYMINDTGDPLKDAKNALIELAITYGFDFKKVLNATEDMSYVYEKVTAAALSSAADAVAFFEARYTGAQLINEYKLTGADSEVTANNAFLVAAADLGLNVDALMILPAAERADAYAIDNQGDLDAYVAEAMKKYEAFAAEDEEFNYDSLYVKIADAVALDFFRRNAYWNDAPEDTAGITVDNYPVTATGMTQYRNDCTTYFRKFQTLGNGSFFALNISGTSLQNFLYRDGYITMRNDVNVSSMAQLGLTQEGTYTIQFVMQPNNEYNKSMWIELRNVGISLRNDTTNGQYFVATALHGAATATNDSAAVGYFDASTVNDFTFVQTVNSAATPATTMTGYCGTTKILSATTETNSGSFYSLLGWQNSNTADIYAIRVYPGTLTEAQIKQNHFADLAKFFKLDLLRFEDLTDATITSLYDAMMAFNLKSDRAAVQAKYNEIMTAQIYVPYLGVNEVSDRCINLAATYGADVMPAVALSTEFRETVLEAVDAAFKFNVKTTKEIIDGTIESAMLELFGSAKRDPVEFTQKELYDSIYVHQDRLMTWADFFSADPSMNDGSELGALAAGGKETTFSAVTTDRPDVFRAGNLSTAGNTYGGGWSNYREFFNGYFRTNPHANIMGNSFAGLSIDSNDVRTADATYEFVYSVVSGSGTNLQLDNGRFDTGIENNKYYFVNVVYEQAPWINAAGNGQEKISTFGRYGHIAASNDAFDYVSSNNRFVSTSDATVHTVSYVLDKDYSVQQLKFFACEANNLGNYMLSLQTEITEAQAIQMLGDSWNESLLPKAGASTFTPCPDDATPYVNGKPVVILITRYEANSSYGVYVDQTKLIEETNRGYSFGNSLLVGLSSSTMIDWYSIRIYDIVLTEDEMNQNHFADLCKYYGLDITKYLTLNEADRQSVHSAMAKAYLGDKASKVQALYTDAISATYYKSLEIEGEDDFNAMLAIAGQYNLDVSAFAGRDAAIALTYANAFDGFDTTLTQKDYVLQYALDQITTVEKTDKEFADGVIEFLGYQVRLGDSAEKYPGVRALFTVNEDALAALTETGKPFSFGVSATKNTTESVTIYEDGNYVGSTIEAPDGSTQFVVAVVYKGSENQTLAQLDADITFKMWVTVDGATYEFACESPYYGEEVNAGELYTDAYSYAEYNDDELVSAVVKTETGVDSLVKMTLNGKSIASYTVVYDNAYTAAMAEALANAIEAKTGIKILTVEQGALASPVYADGDYIWLCMNWRTNAAKPYTSDFYMQTTAQDDVLLIAADLTAGEALVQAFIDTIEATYDEPTNSYDLVVPSTFTAIALAD